MNVREKALKILQEFRSQLDELDMSRQEYTKLQSYSRKVFKKMGELEAEPVETTGGCCDRCKCKCIIPSGEKVDCFNPSCPCHQPKDKRCEICLAVPCYCVHSRAAQQLDKTFLRETPTEIKILPSPRLDWCVECQAIHGYDCPKETPKGKITYSTPLPHVGSITSDVAPKLPEKLKGQVVDGVWYTDTIWYLHFKINEIINYLEKHG